jgi:hypothetical protein
VGVIFDIDERQKSALDAAEGLRKGYKEKATTVLDESGKKRTVFLYVANANSIDTRLRPYSWYKRFVVEGARQHALPNEYVEFIAAFPEMEDGDRERDRKERSIAG